MSMIGLLLSHDLGILATPSTVRTTLGTFCSGHSVPSLSPSLRSREPPSRGRASTVVERMRSEFGREDPMTDRIAQDIFAGLIRQFDAREGWLMTRGGLGRLEETVSEHSLLALAVENLALIGSETYCCRWPTNGCTQYARRRMPTDSEYRVPMVPRYPQG